MRKKVFCILLFVLLITAITSNVLADVMSDMKNGMKPVMNADVTSDAMNNTLSNVIRLIQYVGSGIALIVVSIYGIRYMVASPADKADIKKQIMPILTGCVLLFGAVNIVSLVFSIADSVLPKT